MRLCIILQERLATKIKIIKFGADMCYRLIIFIVFIFNYYSFANTLDSKNSSGVIESSTHSSTSNSQSNTQEKLQNIESNDIKLPDSITKDSKENKNDDFLKDYEISTWRYISVIAVMVLILVILYIIRLRQNKGEIISNITLEQAKILDSKNKVAIIKYDNKRYLIGLNPNGITLIDKIYENHNFSNSTNSQNKDSKNEQKVSNFETMLESNFQDSKENAK